MLKGLDHVNISTHDMAATLAFFEKLFDLRSEAAPGQDAALNSWLYDAQGAAIIHVNLREERTADGPVDHVAFDCEDYDGMCGRLDAAGVAATAVDNRVISGRRQLFVRAPGGAKIELSFREA